MLPVEMVGKPLDSHPLQAPVLPAGAFFVVSSESGADLLTHIMSSGRGFIGSLAVAILLLLAGMGALLFVSYKRDQQYEEELRGLRQMLLNREEQLDRMKAQTYKRITFPDTSWNTPVDSVKSGLPNP
ncbi:MAG: hypothetical protein EAZ91_14780 [Cytophagales bacterium]|nr:MAG: hypothetical protein EAZ91_14780 [Cytophagales bacterium]